MTKRISTAAYLAGVTTLAVSLPVMAETRSFDPSGNPVQHVEKAAEAQTKLPGIFKSGRSED